MVFRRRTTKSSLLDLKARVETVWIIRQQHTVRFCSSQTQDFVFLFFGIPFGKGRSNHFATSSHGDLNQNNKKTDILALVNGSKCRDLKVTDIFAFGKKNEVEINQSTKSNCNH